MVLKSGLIQEVSKSGVGYFPSDFLAKGREISKVFILETTLPKKQKEFPLLPLKWVKLKKNEGFLPYPLINFQGRNPSILGEMMTS